MVSFNFILMCKKNYKLLSIIALLLSFQLKVNAQSNYISSFSLESADLQRWEALQGGLNYSSLPNKSWTEKAIHFDVRNSSANALFPGGPSDVSGSVLTSIDLANIQRLKSLHGIWYENSSGMPATPMREKPILRYFYKTKNNFFDVYSDNLYLAVNPVLGLEAHLHKDHIGYKNFRGIEAKGILFNKIGFYTKFGDNQLYLDDYTQDITTKERSLYGHDYARNLETNKYDLFEATAYVNIALYKNMLNVTAGYDRHFVGYGLRSLVLDEEGAAQSFINLQGRWKRWSYDFLYLELIDDYYTSGDQILPKKYGQIHQLNYDINHKVRVGLFEKSILASNTAFNPLSIVPIPGLQSIRQSTGSNIQSEMGLQAKALVAKGFTLYTQAFIKDVDWNNLGKNTYKNQWAAQLGFQYYNVFTIRNLDLQAEVNVVRPFAYSSKQPGYNYTHYNQPLAHPLGSNFIEAIGKMRYQPHPKINLFAIGSLAKRGEERSSIYNGENPKTILNDETKVPHHSLVGIWKNSHSYHQFNGRAWIQYEWSPSIFILGGANYRHHWKSDIGTPAIQTIAPFIGLHWHFSNRILMY